MRFTIMIPLDGEMEKAEADPTYIQKERVHSTFEAETERQAFDHLRKLRRGPIASELKDAELSAIYE